MLMRPDWTARSKVAEIVSAISRALLIHGLSTVSMPALAVSWISISERLTTLSTRAEAWVSAVSDFNTSRCHAASVVTKSAHWRLTVSVVPAMAEELSRMRLMTCSIDPKDWFMAWEVSRTPSALLLAPLPASRQTPILTRIPSRICWMELVAWEVCNESARISDATTAKPLPASPRERLR